MSSATEKVHTVATWEEMESPLVWSIFDLESYAAYENEEGPRSDLKLDLRAPEGVPDGIYTVVHHSVDDAPDDSPDGIYPVVHDSIRSTNTVQMMEIINGYGHTTGEAHGVQIKDGHFVPEPTAKACFEALALSEGMQPEKSIDGGPYFDHVFIEEWKLDPQSGKLIVSLGS